MLLLLSKERISSKFVKETIIMMQQEIILERPTGRKTLVPKKDMVYKEPMDEMVLDASTMTLLDVTEITMETAESVILIPRIAGG